MAQSHGYWRAAAARLWQDKLARACIVILVFYFGLTFAAAVGLVAEDWNEEVGVSYANPSFLPNYPNPQGKNTDIKYETFEIDAATRAIDPLAPHYDAIERRAKEYQEIERERAWTLPFGGDRWGRDVVTKTIK